MPFRKLESPRACRAWHHGPAARLAIVLAAASALAGCGEVDVKAKHGPALLPKLEALARLYDPAGSSRYQMSLWPTANVEGLDFTDEPSSNAIVVLHDDLKDLKTYADVSLRIADLSFDPFRIAQRILGLVKEGQGYLGPKPSVYEDDLLCVVRAKYALVVVIFSADAPALDSSFEKFTPGKVEGMAVLFDIDKAEMLGGFELTATSSDEVRSRTELENQNNALWKDLCRQTGEAVQKGIKARFPGAKRPVTFGM